MKTSGLLPGVLQSLGQCGDETLRGLVAPWGWRGRGPGKRHLTESPTHWGGSVAPHQTAPEGRAWTRAEEEHGPGHRPEVLAAPPAGVSGHLAWTEGPLQALAPPQPRLPPRCLPASLDLPRVVCTPLPGPMGKAGRAEGSWSLSPPRLGDGQESSSIPGTCSQGGSEDAGSELPAAG